MDNYIPLLLAFQCLCFPNCRLSNCFLGFVIELLDVARFFEGFAIVVGFSPAICFVRYYTLVERGYFSTLYI